MCSDSQLIDLCLSGDQRAYERLYYRHIARVRNYLKTKTSKAHIIEDLCQETFLKAFTSLDQFRGDSLFSTWLIRVATNTLYNDSVKRSRELTSIGSLDEEVTVLINQKTQDTPLAMYEANETARRIATKYIALKPALKQALKLRMDHWMSYEEIATRLQKPVGTVRSRIFRAMEQLEAAA